MAIAPGKYDMTIQRRSDHNKQLLFKDSNNYDGGIDIRAVKILDNEETLYAIVQCKHWQKPIPPGEMRDFITACNEEKSEFKKVKIFMSSSKFSPKARSLAQDHDIQIINGDMLIG